MLVGLTIRDVVLIEALDLALGEGMTALTGETGAGKSIVLDALGLATGARAEGGMVRRGATQASAAAVFSPPRDHPVWIYLEEKGLPAIRPRIWSCAASCPRTAAPAPSSTTRPPA